MGVVTPPESQGEVNHPFFKQFCGCINLKNSDGMGLLILEGVGVFLGTAQAKIIPKKF